MKSLIVIFLVLIASAVGTLMFMEEPGYVLFAYGDMSLETSLAFYIAAMVVVLLLAYGIIRFLVGLFGLPGTMSARRQQKKAMVCQRGLALGMAEMTEGRWNKAEKLLVQSARRGDSPMLNYLSAARAAQMQGATDRRDDYLRQAAQAETGSDVAVGLTQAELQLDHGEYPQATSALRHLNDIAPNHPQLLRLRARLYQETGDSASLLAVLPDLRKARAQDNETLDRMETEAFASRAQELAEAGELAKLEGLWVNLPKTSRNRHELVEPYARALIRLNEHDRAEAVLRTAIKGRWNEKLVYLYGLLSVNDANRAIGVAEGWLRDHRRDPVLLLTLGRLCKLAKAWGKARGYLESSVAARPNAEAYRELGELLEQLGEEKLAQDAYRKGLQVAVDGGVREPAIPSAPKAEEEQAQSLPAQSGRKGKVRTRGKLTQPRLSGA
ncbi:heme biosynthesis HemY N-terminal domain-containing protein [Ectothiorhodospira mobilis]|uniref:heme biosynthesis HemY N-terminal domain-containing protein n=1 Tax=Ectothiorhodospira mobilis TaxID=195064 RepID=UPI001EE7AF70|nr:heme biosynthesis HemY N-terminal domain-containing protein [Ectothiorhodospira mobilis]MCG5536141.1 heme biosynthesis protein HemY [Ectothiorhodospira mobilis]